MATFFLLDSVKTVIEVMINGKSRQFTAAMPISAVLAVLELTGKRVAVERNGDIVPRSQFDSVAIAHGDTLEIVVAVGGG
ncbi:sulfur carrier protein ThiS [Chitinivorax sp. B]|uniref:sulfur carrier protein ThiS n=1 Tax=Chitinivorax sp. B TaxID=2502235 RepID=UPI002016F642|nr:sulfur carrier protein ThiS [Chitinivorax sp. B]